MKMFFQMLCEYQRLKYKLKAEYEILKHELRVKYMEDEMLCRERSINTK